MSQELSSLDLLTLASAVGSWLAAGFFLAFSICVMPALRKIAVPAGLAAMQSINVVVINPWFMTIFLGTAAACVATIVAGLMRWHDPRAICWLLGGSLHLVGTFLVTMIFNVPRNNALAALSATSAEAGPSWSDYVSSWTAWNHVRTIAALLAAMLFTFALRLHA